MRLRTILQQLVRRTCHWYPALYDRRNAQQARALARARAVHDPDFHALTAMRGRATRAIDVGANMGQTIVSLAAVLPDVRVRSYEPQPETAAVAREIAERLGTADVHVAAVGEVPGHLALHVPSCRGIRFTQLASTRPIDPERITAFLRAHGFRWARPADVVVATHEVPVVTLDDDGGPADLIKIDVEGADDAVLRGATRLLATQRPVLLVEDGARPVIRAPLEAIGYRACRVRGTALEALGAEAPLNVLFVHPDAPRGLAVPDAALP
ncbi:MAG: FkbM family methyltransferase [Gemmatimonadales bacterium]|nr:FkbM family methyltransferase [Gemmatimonadales bacterium]